jgi:ABC-type spermidine/putrescine transport system permease subunit I
MKDQMEKNGIMATVGLVCIHAIAEYLTLLERGLNMLISELIGYEIDDNLDN